MAYGVQMTMNVSGRHYGIGVKYARLNILKISFMARNAFTLH